MEFSLFDYQREATAEVLARLGIARDNWTRHNTKSSFALSAVTASGKTVIAAAVIEAMFYGSADLGCEADPRATFLWVTDDPALNRQTRSRMLEASDLLQPGRLVEIDNGFLNSELSPGRVYFLNVQKLSRKSGLASGGSNLRQFSMWEIIANTINSDVADLYLVLDEAHRGMKQATDRKTIVRRLITGQTDTNPGVPVVWGISATIDRFTQAMDGIHDRSTLPAVAVDLAKVRASGLVKDQIELDEPDEKGTFSTTLLRDAVLTARDFEERWAAYATAEHEPLVVPVMVVQVPDKASETKLGELITTIESEWPGLGPDAIVNVFGDHPVLDIGDRRIRWVPPESIQDDTDIRIVFAKEAISTGWDCPRAEVLYSERPAKDATHIAQVIGRMVRQPLARRIPTDDALNSVSCYLPLFNRDALTKIKDALEQPGEPGGASTVAIRTRLFPRSSAIDPAVFDLIEGLPSIPTPDTLANPIRRAKALVQLLTNDSLPGGALLPEAGAKLMASFNKRLDGLAAEHADQVAANIVNLETAEVNKTTVTHTGEEISSTTRTLVTHERDIDRDTRRIIGAVKEGVGKDYFAYRVRTEPDSDRRDIRVSVAALLMIEEVTAELQLTATKFVREQLTKFAVDIKQSTGVTRDGYTKVQEQTSRPERVGIELLDNDKAPTENTKGKVFPTFPGHIYCDADGLYPADLNDWESAVIEAETARTSFVAWYRNPARATRSSLRIAYQDDADRWKSLQVDFLVISRRDDGTLAASIIDPHGDHLADARAKLLALAQFAEDYSTEFLRVVSIAKSTDGALRSLDLTEPKVRDVVRSFEGAKVTALYETDAAVDYL